MGLVKFACAIANRDLGKLTGSGKNPLTAAQVDALLAAAKEVAAGKFELTSSLSMCFKPVRARQAT